MANGLIKFDSLGMERQANLFEFTLASTQRFNANRLTLAGGIPCQERLPRRLSTWTRPSGSALLTCFYKAKGHDAYEELLLLHLIIASRLIPFFIFQRS